MGLYKQVTPQPPLPHETYSRDREQDTLRALDEAKVLLQRLVTALDPFEPRQFTTKEGMIVRGLVQILGRAPDSDSTLPFAVIAPNSPSDAQVLVQVYGFSSLFTSIKVEDDFNIDNLGTDFPIAVGDKIVLLIELDNTVSVTSATIAHGAPGSTLWDEYPDPISINTDDPDNPYQDYYNQLIAECVDPTDERPGTVFSVGGTSIKVVQCLNTNLIAALWNVDGMLCLVPESWQAPGS